MDNGKPIDLRSDTVTKPSRKMREAIAAAEVGDDVFGEDPTVNLLQARVASLLGKEAALFVPSGVMANQLAIKCHTQPGDEIVVERLSHIFNYEAGAPSLLSNVQLNTIEGRNGILTTPQIEKAIRSEAYYMPRTSLVCLENTHNMGGGTIYPLDEIRKIRSVCVDRRVAMHLDGARLWNAWVATGIHPKEYAREFDSVSVCFSKGLGAPVGSALAGSKDLVAKSRKYRKIFGGGMRQAGILAAGALYALENNVDRLKEDHEKAVHMVTQLSQLQQVGVDRRAVQTNIVLVDITRTGKTAANVLSLLREQGVLLTEAGERTLRAVMHMDVSMDDVKKAVAIIKQVLTA